MESSVEITPELLAGFIDEADEYLATLSELLMQLEDEAAAGPISFAAGDKLELMNVMFRAAHSLKGLSGAFGFAEMNSLNHRMETLFDEARMGNRLLDSNAIEGLLLAQGVIQEQVEELKSPSDAQIDVVQAMDKLQSILDGQKPEASESQPAEAEVEPEPEKAERAIPASVLDDPELRSLFIQTTEEDVDELNQKLLLMEEAAEKEVLTDAFRIAHTIKGACGAAGLPDAHDLTHGMETLLDRLLNGRLSISDQLMTTLLTVADRLREVVEEIKKDQYLSWTPEKVESVFEAWNTTANAHQDAPSQSTVSPAETPPAEDTDPPSDKQNLSSVSPGFEGSAYCVEIEFDTDHPESPLQPFLVYNKLQDIGQVISCDPDIENDPGTETISTLRATVAADDANDESAFELKQLLNTFKVKTVSVKGPSGIEAEAPATQKEADSVPQEAAPVTKQPKTAASPASKKSAAANKSPMVQETVRVDVDRLDQLMNLGGELIINRSQFSQVEREFKDIFEGKDQSFLAEDIAQRLGRLSDGLSEINERFDGAGKALSDLLSGVCQDYSSIVTAIDRIKDQRTTMHNLSEAVNTLGRVSDTMQKQIMGTRMVPVGPLFTRFKRVVRDIAKNLGKKIDYRIVGEHTELDKKMIDELGDPLTHMIRNSVDHGIEMPEDREKAGKKPVGVLTLEAYHQGNSICIRLTDDGKGIDVEAIRKKVVLKEIVSESQANQLTDKELVQYVFHPGMTTAKKVSDVSGRGMGMDIVMSKIANLNGTVDVESTAGVGTTVTIKLPLTLAIITSLVSRIGGEVYAIPLEAVSEIVTINQENTNSIQGKLVMTVRGQVIPICKLEELLDTDIADLKTRSQDGEEWTLVILGSGTSRLGLVVDELLGQEDIVIKSLAENYANVPGFVGATIMGDGRIALILDPAYLQESSNGQANKLQAEVSEVPN